MQRGRDGDFASTVAVIEALDWLVSERVAVVGLSLAGGDNAILAAAISAAQARGMLIAAAVGNSAARAEPRFPAAYPDVLGVTAVDARLRLYRDANQGSFVDIASPGVGLTAPRPGGGVQRVSGTSFAVPFVVAALALELQAGASPAAAVRAMLTSARDLGAPGRDPRFGAGLVQLNQRGCGERR